jgi:septal ring factor EnvC (AmiA/AmiB activator)
MSKQQIEKLIKEIENIRNLLSLIESRIKQLEYNKIINQMNKMSETNDKRDDNYKYTNKLIQKLKKRSLTHLRIKERFYYIYTKVINVYFTPEEKIFKKIESNHRIRTKSIHFKF